jgi:hypothetical protein
MRMALDVYGQRRAMHTANDVHGALCMLQELSPWIEPRRFDT